VPEQLACLLDTFALRSTQWEGPKLFLQKTLKPLCIKRVPPGNTKQVRIHDLRSNMYKIQSRSCVGGGGGERVFRYTKRSENLFHGSPLSIIHFVPRKHMSCVPSASHYAQMAESNNRVRYMAL
jgi:hypothetical protein